jgi:metal-responsive CopG/Arc/MetJ family transcriptional regulator
MRQAIGIRLPKEVLRQIEKLSKEEMEDRSTVIRKLVLIGYRNFVKRKAAEEYIKGNITLSEAGHRAGLTIWEMEKYLVEQGFKSSYSVEDLQKEMKILEK